MRTVKLNQLLSVKNSVLLLTLYLTSGSASAEYYILPAPTPTMVVAESAPPCRVYRDYKCERRVAYRCRTGCRTRSPCQAPRRARCSTATVSAYYAAPVCNTWSSCNPCNSCNTVQVMTTPGFNVVYGPPVYAPDTYNPYYYYNSDWDLRTSDDYYY